MPECLAYDAERLAEMEQQWLAEMAPPNTRRAHRFAALQSAIWAEYQRLVAAKESP